MKRLAVLALLLVNACGAPAQAQQTLLEARAAHASTFQSREKANEPLATPPKGVFQKVTYRSPVGELGAYVTPPPADGGKRPAIIWLTGGDSNTIGDVWSPADPANDQSASAYRKAGIVMMFPSLRGGNQNPGYREAFYGEVDDILAAADYLASLPYVDPGRIYLGGHSTGGTLVLLTAEMTDRFRAVFAFGPVSQAADYGGDFLPTGLIDRTDLRLRSPVFWLSSIKSPVFVIEGDARGNADSLQELAQAGAGNPNLRTLLVPGYSHFSVLGPMNRQIAGKILADTGETTNITLQAP